MLQIKFPNIHLDLLMKHQNQSGDRLQQHPPLIHTGNASLNPKPPYQRHG